MKKKKIIVLMVALVLVLSSFSGCGGKADKNTTNGNASNGNPAEDHPKGKNSDDSASGESGKGDYKFTEAGGPDLGGVTLKIGIRPNPFIISYEDNELTEKLEKECNVKLKFYEFPSEADDFKTKLSLMASGGGDLPDVVNSTLDSETLYEGDESE